MAFLLYLFESGVCMLLLYAVYWLFLRKETYFTFNRIYLLLILVFSLLFPVLQVNLSVEKSKVLDPSFREISKIRTYYTDFFIPASETSLKARYRKYSPAFFENSYLVRQPHVSSGDTEHFSEPLNTIEETKGNAINWILILLVIYGSGVVIFMLRWLWLYIWLRKLIGNHKYEANQEYKLFQLEKEVPPFSFFRYIFVAKEATTLKEFEQILEHELVHVKQRHSYDLMLAHVVSVFQWFNPLVWHLHKAMKTNHEYLADSTVVNKGYELFDYQALLLSQLISPRSLALVNNFNLVSIKKRIQMMTKNKSGFSARLKALIVIPSAIVAFFLFAQMTVKSPVWHFSNFNNQRAISFNGLWQSNSPDSYGYLLSFENNTLSVLESVNMASVVEIPVITHDKYFEFRNMRGKVEQIPYAMEGDFLKVWWTTNQVSVYKKTHCENSAQLLLPYAAKDLNLPIAKSGKVLEKPEFLLDVVVLENSYVIAGNEIKDNNLKKVLQNQLATFNVLNRDLITVRIFASNNTPMEGISKLYRVLRNNDLLKIAFAVQPQDNVSKLQFHMTAIPQLLPPKEADYNNRLDKASLGERLIVIEPGAGAQQNLKKFKKHIETHTDYVCSYEWSNSTLYKDYIANIDAFYAVMYSKREDFAKSEHHVSFAELPPSIQKEIRKKYPLRISQTNVDVDK